MCIRSGCPSACQYRRASFAAVSIASPPPVVKNTRGVVHRRDAGELLRELERGRIRDVAEDRVRLERPQLLGDRIRDLGSAVADVAVPEARAPVEVAVAGLVPHVHALAADEHELVAAHRRHVGEGVPEARIAHMATLTCRLTLASSSAGRISCVQETAATVRAQDGLAGA